VLSAAWVFAQDADQSSSGSGVLVSGGSNAPDSPDDQGSLNNSEQKDHQNSNDASAPQNAASNPPTDPIIVKATDAVMFQVTANMKLTQDQINAIRLIVTDNLSKVRDLQLSVQKGNIDSKEMYSQKEQLFAEEDQKLSHILTPDQMKIWVNIQGQ
jgi:hypothetical protein